jgi:ribosomal protein S27E
VNRSASVRIQCPGAGCAVGVYVPADSNRERVDCASCGAEYITRRNADGTVAIAPHQPEVVL